MSVGKILLFSLDAWKRPIIGDGKDLFCCRRAGLLGESLASPCYPYRYSPVITGPTIRDWIRYYVLFSIEQRYWMSRMWFVPVKHHGDVMDCTDWDVLEM